MSLVVIIANGLGMSEFFVTFGIVLSWNNEMLLFVDILGIGM